MAGAERKAGAFLGRLIVAHLVAYPVALVWVVAAMPAAFPIFGDEITRTTGDVDVLGVNMPAAAWIVVRATLVFGALPFAIEHAIGVAWALGKDEARARRRFVVASAVLGGLGVVAAVCGWIWYVLHYGGEPS